MWCKGKRKGRDFALPIQTYVPALLPIGLHHAVLQAEKLRRTIIDADARRLKRKIAHSAPGSVEVKPVRKKKIIVEQE